MQRVLSAGLFRRRDYNYDIGSYNYDYGSYVPGTRAAGSSQPGLTGSGSIWMSARWLWETCEARRSLRGWRFRRTASAGAQTNVGTPG